MRSRSSTTSCSTWPAHRPDLISLRTANWRTGGPYRTLIYRQGIEASLLYQIVAYLAGASSVRYAVGKWLDWLGEGIFNEPRQEAQFATVTMQFTVPLGAGPLGPLELRVATPSGLEFVSVNLETIPPGPAVVSFPFKAAKAGAAWNVGANTITQLVSPNVLGISVTNPAAAIGAMTSSRTTATHSACLRNGASYRRAALPMPTSIGP